MMDVDGLYVPPSQVSIDHTTSAISAHRLSQFKCDKLLLHSSRFPHIRRSTARYRKSREHSNREFKVISRSQAQQEGFRIKDCRVLVLSCYRDVMSVYLIGLFGDSITVNIDSKLIYNESITVL